MIELYVKIDAASNFKVDVDARTSVALNKSLLDITDIQKRNGDFTKTFLLPATEKNNTFFGHWHDVGFQGTYNQYTVQRCQLFDGLNLLVDGNIKLVGYNRNNKTYEVLVFGALNTVANIIGDQKMSTIGGNWIHLHDQATIISSWSLAVQGGRVLYPMIDYGYGYGYGTYNIGSSSFPVLLEKLIPGLRLYDLMDRLFIANGITITNFADFITAWDMVYCQLLESPPVGQIATKTFTADDYGISFLQIPAAWTVMPFTIPAGDPDYNNTLYEFTAVYPGTYYFEIHITTHGGSPAQVNQVRGWKNNAVQVYFSSQAQNISNFDRSFSVVLAATDILEIQIQTSSTDPLNYIIKNEGDYWKLTQLVTTAVVTPNYDPVETLMKNIRQIDFLKGFLELANYVLIQDPDQEFSYTLLPIEQWYVEGVTRNYTDKLDISKPIKNSATNDILSRNVVLSYGNSEDYLNRIYREDNGDNYGTFRDDVNIANTEQKDKKSELFCPYPTDVVPGAVQTLIIPKWVKAEDDLTLQKPAKLQLFYFNGLIACNTFYIDYSAAVPAPVSRTTYPNCSNYELIGGVVTAASKDLNFGYAPPFQSTYMINGIPVDNLYGLYYSKYLAEIYSPSNRILNASLLLTPGDVEALKFNDIIQIDIDGTPAAWRPQKMTDYMLDQAKPTKMQLTKAAFGVQPTPGNLIWVYVDPASQIVDKLGLWAINNQGWSVATPASGPASMYNSTGTDDMIYTNFGPAWNNTRPWSYITWIWPVTGVGTCWIMTKGSNVNREGAVFLWNDGNLYSRVYSSGVDSIGKKTARPATGAWKMVVTTYDGSGVEAGNKIYYNGVLQIMTTGSTGAYSDNPLTGPVNSGELFDSTVYSTDAHYTNDVRIQNTELTVNEILKMFNDEKSKYGL